MNSKDTTTEDKEKQHIEKEIMEAVESINYGEVVIAIHDRRVVQIEKRDKKRFK